ncbi:MAG: tetratricopeptide repeat protein [Blastocatellia bacterium]
MKNRFCVLYFSLFILAVNLVDISAKVPILLNRVEGVVYDPNHLPVENINVELLNDIDSVIGRTRTSASGRFTFTGMPAGRFIVKALPFGTNFMEQTQEVIINNVSRAANDIGYVDIYLRYDKRNSGGANETSREVVFAQDVPAAAKKLYQEGVADFGKSPEKGLAKLEEALRIFPQYFDGLSWLGKAFISQKNYEKAYPYLIRAIDINPRSYSAYYSLGYAFYQIKQYPAALEAARATTVLATDSIDAQLLYGTLLRITEKYQDAEKALLKANSLAKKMNSEVHWQLALLYNRLKRNQDTVDELETFLKLAPDSPDKSKIQDMIAKLKNSAR